MKRSRRNPNKLQGPKRMRELGYRLVSVWVMGSVIDRAMKKAGLSSFAARVKSLIESEYGYR